MNYKSSIALLLVILLFLSGLGSSPDEAEFIENVTPENYLFETRGFAILDETIVTLTEAEPVVNVYGKEQNLNFGKKGEGPGEFQEPAQVDISRNGKIGVIDMPAPGSVKLVIFDSDGKLESEKTLRELGVLSSFSFISGEDFVAVSSQFGSDEQTLKHYDGENYYPIYSYKSNSETLYLEEGPVPRFTINLPFTDSFEWTPYSDTKIAIWKGGNKIEIVNLKGEVQEYIELNLSKITLTSELKEYWIDQRYPAGKKAFGHDNFYKGLRKVMQNEISFPNYLPVVLDLEKDPSSNGLWIKSKIGSKGQVWSHLTREGVGRTTTFPPGREVIGFSSNYAYAVYTDEKGFDIIEKYRP